MAYESPHMSTGDVSEDRLYSTTETTTGYPFGENIERHFDPNHLSPEDHLKDPVSRSPSPLPSPRPSRETISFDHWHRRYDIHNEATSELYGSLFALSTFEDASYLRYAFLPLVILALVSKAESSERALSIEQLERFKYAMARMRTAQNPVGGAMLNFDIPWGRLDAYSVEMEQQRHGSALPFHPQLHNAAPEWNWWYMLKRTDLDLICE
jgi:hypothetical protein